MEKENQVRFGLWKPKSGAEWPIAGSIYDQTENGKFKPNKTLTDLSAFIQAAINHGDRIRFAVFPNDRKTKDNQPDYNVIVSVLGEYKQGSQPSISSDKDDDSDLPF